MIHQFLASSCALVLVGSLLGCAKMASAEQADMSSGTSSPRLRSDFNGDGIGDLAIGAPRGTVAGRRDAGIVYVLYGTKSGLAKEGRQVWTQDSPGIADEAEDDDQFGFVLAAGDFDADGFSDLAVGVPLENVGEVGRGGAVHVLYGSGTGLTAGGSQLWTKDSPGLVGDLTESDEFGTGLASGDFGNGPADDLAVSVPVHGAVHVLYGRSDGLTGEGSQVWTQNTSGVPGSAGESDLFGNTLAAGDVGRSGQADLIVSAAYANIDGVPQAGSVTVIYGSADGLDAAGSQLWSRSSPGIADVPGEFDLFGDSLAIGDFGRSSVGDLAISVPFDDPGGHRDAGGVQVLYGTADGLIASGSQYWSQDTRGVRGKAERRDGFGYNLAAADLGRSRRADLAVGVHGENQGVGAVNILYGGSDGLTAAGDQVLSQDTRGIAGVAEKGDQFSYPLAASDLGRNSRADLVIGVAFENADSGDSHAGLVHLVYGSSTGLRPDVSQVFTQRRIDSASVAQRGSEFGRALSGK